MSRCFLPVWLLFQIQRWIIPNAVMKKLRTIVVPYICFSLLSIIAFGVLSVIYPSVASSRDCNVFRNICVMLYGNSKPDAMKYNSPLWFLSCFFVVNILSLLLEPFIIKNNGGGVKTLSCINAFRSNECYCYKPIGGFGITLAFRNRYMRGQAPEAGDKEN